MDAVAAWFKAAAALAGLVFWLLVLGAVLGIFSSSDGDADATSRTKSAVSAVTTTKQPYYHQVMDGDGTYRMGGVDGKDWGIYATRVPWDSRGCKWSANGVHPNSAGKEFFSGEGQPGDHLRVLLTPGDRTSPITGKFDSGWRVVFVTNGCGTWEREE